MLRRNVGWLMFVLLVACEAAPTPAPSVVAIVATPRPLASPTNTPRPTATPPPRPARMSDVPPAVAAFLNAAPQNLDWLRPALAAWGVNTSAKPLANMGDVLLTADVDGDGQLDLLLALAPAEPGDCELGAVALYLHQATGYRLAQQIGLLDETPIDPAVSHIPCPKLFAARDLLHDGHNEIILTATRCTTLTCIVRVDVLRWRNDTLESLMPTPRPSMAYPEIVVQERSEGAAEVVLVGGVVGGMGAGPQRERRELYRWNGSWFAVAEAQYAASNYLYFKMALVHESKNRRSAPIQNGSLRQL